MAVTVSEANALSSLLRHLTGDDPHGVGPVSRETAEADLALLLAASNKRLMAGYRPEDAGRLLDLAAKQGEDDEGTSDAEIHATIDVYSHSGTYWLQISGEMFGPCKDADQALDAIPHALRSME